MALLNSFACLIIRAVKLGEYVNKQINKQKIKALCFIQMMITLFLSGFFTVAFSINAGVSALLGGLVYVIPNLVFAAILFKNHGARAARQIVKNFYQGEALKIILSIGLFTGVFVVCKLTPLAFFVSYMLIQMTHWFSPRMIDYKIGKKRDRNGI